MDHILNACVVVRAGMNGSELALCTDKTRNSRWQSVAVGEGEAISAGKIDDCVKHCSSCPTGKWRGVGNGNGAGLNCYAAFKTKWTRDKSECVIMYGPSSGLDAAYRRRRRAHCSNECYYIGCRHCSRCHHSSINWNRNWNEEDIFIALKIN